MKRTLGRYELQGEGRPGAAGVVWEAWDPDLARQVAIEIVPLGSAELTARFQREAKAAGELARAGVVQVYDYGDIGGQAFIVREFVAGETLRQVLDRGEPVPIARAIAIMLDVLTTLEACHRLGTVHHELRPRNILLAKGGRVRLTGFGVAQIRAGEGTLTGTAWDMSPYLSPEQITDRPPIDARSDLWSCGVVLYELLTGRHPFRTGDPMMTGQAIVHDDPEPPSRFRAELPHALDETIARALRKAPADRFSGAAAFSEAIRAATAIPAPDVGEAKRPFPRIALLGAGAAVAVAVVAAGLWVWMTAGETVKVAGSPVPVAPVPVAPIPVSPTPVSPTPVSPTPVSPAPSLSQRLLAIPCSTVSVTEDSGAASFRGILGSGAPRNTLDALIAERPSGSSTTAVRTFPASPTSCRMAELVRTNAGPSPGRLLPQGGDAPLRPGAELRLRLQAPPFDGEVRLEDLDAEGRLQHVMEANLGFAPRYTAGTTIGLGRGGNDLIGRATESSSSEIMVAIMTSAPLFPQPRPITEPGAAYLDALNQALAELRRQGGTVSMDAVVLTVVP